MRNNHESRAHQNLVKDGNNGGLAFDDKVSNAFTGWGQYIVHDILQTADAHDPAKQVQGCYLRRNF